MAVLAGCGLIYEYLLSAYAGRILGTLESTIYTMIGLMIVSMGLGSFAARLFKEPFTTFAWLESLIAFFGVSCILLIAIAVSISSILPRVIAETFNLPPDLVPKGGLLEGIRQVARMSPYFFGVIIGFFIGMEIPLIARVRERVHGEHLEHNTGTIYGADYIGAGAGAAIWVTFMLSIDITKAAVITATANVIAGLVFLYLYWPRIKLRKSLLIVHGLIAALVVMIYLYGEDWSIKMTNLLYEDEVVFSYSTRYQHFVVTERYLADREDSVYGFYINGRLQFSSTDEHVYHSMLVYPPMLVANKNSHVLIIGGGDGLALRDVLRFEPEAVTLIDLDTELVDFFTYAENMPDYRVDLVELNDRAFSDEQVTVIHGDAFIQAERLVKAGERYDVIIVDLPDPSHPDLDRMYSTYFYERLADLLKKDGAMSVQSTSPYHAKYAFLSIGKTIKAAGFSQVEQYRQNIPSFGEWGWTLATHSSTASRRRLIEMKSPDLRGNQWLTVDLLVAAFEFPGDFFSDLEKIEVNHLGQNRIYRYHDEAWRRDMGIYKD
ncbi:MAG: spermidine synthase [Candidatus Azotimanducaceae bacterium]|jgi:spermidine synthase